MQEYREDTAWGQSTFLRSNNMMGDDHMQIRREEEGIAILCIVTSDMSASYE